MYLHHLLKFIAFETIKENADNSTQKWGPLTNSGPEAICM